VERQALFMGEKDVKNNFSATKAIRKNQTQFKNVYSSTNVFLQWYCLEYSPVLIN